jgi:hypothetical protein
LGCKGRAWSRDSVKALRDFCISVKHQSPVASCSFNKMTAFTQNDSILQHTWQTREGSSCPFPG